MADTPTNPFLHKDENGQLTITEQGYQELDRVLTDSRGQVYAFNENASPLLVAAAMARLSRRQGDMRLTYLDEFATTGKEGAEKLIERVVTGYGDDSVQQLGGLQFVVEGASNWLTKQLERGRLAAYLEQSTRYIYFDQKDAGGRYLYFTPKNLDVATVKEYEKTMDAIFEKYSAMVHALTEHVRSQSPEPTDKKERVAWVNATRAKACDAVRAVLPTATKSTVGIFASYQALEMLVMRLLSEPMQEAREVGESILAQGRKVAPTFLRRADIPERGGATTAYRALTRQAMRDIVKNDLKSIKPEHQEVSVQLLDFWPKKELELLPGMLFEFSAPMVPADVKKQVEGWPKAKQEEVFAAYMGERLNRRHRPGRAAEKAHFEWVVVGDYGTFRDLQRHRLVDEMQWQGMTPYLGYEVPELVKEAGLEKEFRACFELSEKLYDLLQEKDYEQEAQYATLLGHRIAYRLTANLREMFHLLELRTQPDGHPGYRKICLAMYEELQKVYPLSAKAMRFVNQKEDPALVRMAAEVATQFKLEQLEAQEATEAKG